MTRLMSSRSSIGGRPLDSRVPARTSRFRSRCPTAAWASKRSPLSPRTRVCRRIMASCTYWNLRSSLSPPPSASTRTNTRFCGSKPDVDAAQIVQTLEEQPRAHEQDDRDGHLHHQQARGTESCSRPRRCGCFPSARCPRPSSWRAAPVRCRRRFRSSTVMPDVNATMRQSAGADVPTGAGRSGCPQRASARPATPPRPASSRLSVSSWRTSRHRVAPIDSLTEISR